MVGYAFCTSPASDLQFALAIRSSAQQVCVDCLTWCGAQPCKALPPGAHIFMEAGGPLPPSPAQGGLWFQPLPSCTHLTGGMSYLWGPFVVLAEGLGAGALGSALGPVLKLEALGPIWEPASR